MQFKILPVASQPLAICHKGVPRSGGFLMTPKRRHHTISWYDMRRFAQDDTVIISIPYLFKESSHLRLLSCLCLNKYLCTSCLYLLFYLYQPGFYIENRGDWFTVPVWIFPNMMPASSQTSNNIRPAPAGFMYILHFHNDGICHPHLQNYARYGICRKNSLSHLVIIRISSFICLDSLRPVLHHTAKCSQLLNTRLYCRSPILLLALCTVSSGE